MLTVCKSVTICGFVLMSRVFYIFINHERLHLEVQKKLAKWVPIRPLEIELPDLLASIMVLQNNLAKSRVN